VAPKILAFSKSYHFEEFRQDLISFVRHYPRLDYGIHKERRFPMDDLDGELLSPKRDLTSLYNLAKAPEPVMVFQLNYLKGGLVMTFTAAHNAMDMNGLGKFIELYGKASRGESLTKEETKIIACILLVPKRRPQRRRMNVTLRRRQDGHIPALQKKT
jgi:hypothetical protein